MQLLTRSIVMTVLFMTTTLTAQTIQLSLPDSDISLSATGKLVSTLDAISEIPGTYDFTKNIFNFGSNYHQVMFTIQDGRIHVNFFTKERGDNSTGISMSFVKRGNTWIMSRRTVITQSDVDIIVQWVRGLPTSRKKIRIRFMKHRKD